MFILQIQDMMNCKEIENKMLDYQNNTLDEATRESVQDHLDHCSECSKTHNEFQTLFTTIDQYKEELPDSQLEVGFYEMLEKEKGIAAKSEVLVLHKKQQQLRTVLQIAATVVLMISSYFYGTFKDNVSHIEEVVLLQQEKAQMQTVATLSLIENESASKRLQAVTYAKALVQPDSDILNVLITKMNTDKHVNVRLAAANALAKFSDHQHVKLALLKTLEVEENANMQIELIQILVDIEEKRAIPAMKKLLENTAVPSYVKEQINVELKQIM